MLKSPNHVCASKLIDVKLDPSCKGTIEMDLQTRTPNGPCRRRATSRRKRKRT